MTTVLNSASTLVAIGCALMMRPRLLVLRGDVAEGRDDPQARAAYPGQ